MSPRKAHREGRCAGCGEWVVIDAADRCSACYARLRRDRARLTTGPQPATDPVAHAGMGTVSAWTPDPDQARAAAVTVCALALGTDDPAGAARDVLDTLGLTNPLRQGMDSD